MSPTGLRVRVSKKAPVTAIWALLWRAMDVSGALVPIRFWAIAGRIWKSDPRRDTTTNVTGMLAIRLRATDNDAGVWPDDAAARKKQIAKRSVRVGMLCAYIVARSVRFWQTEPHTLAVRYTMGREKRNVYTRLDNRGRGGGGGRDGGPQMRDLRAFFFGGGFPASISLVVVTVLSFFVFAIGQGTVTPLGNALAFDSDTFPMFAWTLVTWPLVNAEFVGTLFSAIALWMFCGSLERAWGTKTFLTFFFGLAAFTAATYWVGGLLLGRAVGLAGMYFALGAPVVAWCAINRRETVLLYFFPVPAMLVAAITVVALWYQAGPARGVPLLGLFVLPSCALAYWFTTNAKYRFADNGAARLRRVPSVARGSRDGGGSTASGSPRFRDFDRENIAPPSFWRNPLKWWKDRQERKRLERIFRNSGYDA